MSVAPKPGSILAIKAPDQCVGGTRQINPCCSIFGTPHTIGL